MNKQKDKKDILKPKIFLDYQSYPVLNVNQEIDLKIKLNNKKIKNFDKFNIEVNDKHILSYFNGKLKGLSIGSTFIKISLKNDSSVCSYFGILVANNLSVGAKEIIKTLNFNSFEKNIEVFSLDKTYCHNLRNGIGNFLFEDLIINKNIAPKENKNRPLKTAQKKYICIHDTADIVLSAGEWSKVVYQNFYPKTNQNYNVSYQYVVGNDGVYQNIPDNEMAFHAGDGTEYEYRLIKSNVFGNKKNPNITITSDGYFEIDNIKSVILAPKNQDKILTNQDINDFGVKCENVKGEYYLGLTWYNKVYNKIANRGGNCNSIGIESCLEEDTDIHLTWQKMAKLVAYLKLKYKIKFENIVPHQFFSGKLCPHTIIENGCWNYLFKLIKTECKILQLINDGYTFRLKFKNNNLTKNGRIINFDELIKYQIEIIKDNKKEIYTFYYNFN